MWGITFLPGVHTGLRTEGLKCLMMSERTKEGEGWSEGCGSDGCRSPVGPVPSGVRCPGSLTLFQTVTFTPASGREVNWKQKQIELKMDICPVLGQAPY